MGGKGLKRNGSNDENKMVATEQNVHALHDFFRTRNIHRHVEMSISKFDLHRSRPCCLLSEGLTVC